MTAHSAAVLLLGVVGLALLVWLLHKLGRALAAIAETLAAAAVVFVALWWLVKVLIWLVKQLVVPSRAPRLAVLAAAGLVVLARLAVAGHRRQFGRGRAVDVAAGRSRLLRPVGGPVAAVLVAALGHLPAEAARLAACLRPDHPGRRAVPVAVTVNLVGRKKVAAGAVLGGGPVPEGARRPLRWVVGRGAGPAGAGPEAGGLRRGRAGAGLGAEGRPVSGAGDRAQRGVHRLPAPQPAGRRRALRRPGRRAR